MKQIAKNEWIIELPRITETVDDRLEEGIDWIDQDPRQAAGIFLELIEKYQEHMDAYHHLALALEKMGKKEKAFQTWKLSIDNALKFFPSHFSLKRDRLEWGFVENRPFLRLYYSYGLRLLERGRAEDALEVFENILRMNPNDNQGARALVVACHFELKEPSGVLSVCRQFPHDAMEHLVYGKALALFQLHKVKPAEKALKRAISRYPRVAAELLKTRHRKPRGMNENRITFGGADQAYAYWQDHGKYWQQTPGAIEFIRQHCPGESA